ncbi:hypothetical protein A678_04427 [Salmonella enterica subsp. enterica serovar Enteritidis str. 2010K-0271]|uniref:Uncharacterized protein n=3 Tax=Salmonella enterica I TaxID=59201 RepID=A0A0F6B0V8_SALT1|nr:hypothetical protein SPAB_01966 [Salmonella enterica subsp. enterica serovar Paratyphi B str. SPB7]ACY88136.1 hypothetical protein STM14_1658 [Salmonella enterica subsp. enterica serovar Typhimurium str. 14028S]EPI93928.1 hypothetical protein A678_04427 [Salmonella enterica subsp. enterica serovar Enteritidis str. 2010K-0271]ETA85028.1 hypothetical protein A628_05094 [Salmonella enterica subsp. enterica serovar Cubana str. 76814]
MTFSCGLCCERWRPTRRARAVYAQEGMLNRLRVALFVVSHFFPVRPTELHAESAC